MRTIPPKFRGIVPPVVTPLASYDSIDLPGLENLLGRLANVGVDALFVLGTTGEGPALSYRLRAKVIEQACAFVAPRLPVLAGVTDTAYAESLRMADVAAKAGAIAVVAAPPFYYQCGQSELLRHVISLATASPLPLILYNPPSLSQPRFDAKTVAEAAAVPEIVGLKDSSGDMAYLKTVLSLVSEQRPDFSVLVGAEQLLAEALLVGAHGGVPGGANLFPQPFVRLYELYRHGNKEGILHVQREIDSLGAAIWKGSGDVPSGLRRLKCALSIMGICSGLPAFPFTESTLTERQEIESHLRQHALISG